MRIAWTKAASQDLDSIEEYISKDDPLAAIRQVLRVMDAVEENFSGAPSIGKPGRIPGTREFYVTGTPYIVLTVENGVDKSINIGYILIEKGR